ncbi:restriction endonuclease subunit S [Pseudorhodobacter turbinis]|uniref:Restriction endonuclease subunit S n=1 Tax=Pseudorhodobacter turbinis TaxID=2500533 RepID=A0A4P8EFS7_9RHOB|nr:restriction endonuclease subunit S [Pseudorhodobacter turbinis]QCO55562.1 restriction endonuclease subunit S [Pseudorhodobacter turbinis]
MTPVSPKLRFPEFKEPWKPGHAGDAFKNSRAKGAAGLPIYSVTMDRGLVRRDTMERHMAADAADGLNLRAQRGDVVYNMMRMWQGAVGLAHEECMVSPAYVVLSPKEHTSAEFFDQWFKSKRMLYLLGAYSHGITGDRLRLYAQDFARIPLNLPIHAEQQKVATFLRTIDAKLEALSAKQIAVDQFKSGLIDKIFSQKIRFSADDGQAFPDWQEKRLGEVFSERSERNKIKAELLSVTLKNGIQRAAEVDRVNGPSADLSNYKFVQEGDIAYNSMRMWQGASGLSAYDGIVSPAYTIITPKQGQHKKFWAYYFKEPRLVFKFRRYSQGLTSDTWSLKFTALASIKVMIPHPNEQAKIADALSALDLKIEAVATQATKLKNFKGGLLQQMFA